MGLLDILFRKSNADKGDEYFDKARAIYERGAQKINDAEELGEGINLSLELNKGITLSRNARLAYHFDNPKGSNDEAVALNLEASIHRLMANYEKAIDCHEQAINIIDKVEPYSILKAQFLNNQAELHRAKYNRGEARSIVESLDNIQYSYQGDVLITALKYALKAIDEYKIRHPTNSGFIISIHTLGLVCRDFGDFETAEELLKMSTTLAFTIDDLNMAGLSRFCYQDVLDVKKQMKGYNLIRHRAFEYMDDVQKKEAEKLLVKAKVVSEFKK